MKRWMSRGLFAALGLVGCVIWTGCGGGGGSSPFVGASNLTYVRTSDAPGTIRLSWTPSAAQELLGYTIRRRVAGDPNFSLANPHLVQGATYTDQLPNASDVRTLFYQVIAVGPNGRQSAPTEVMAIVSPPSPPAGF